MTQSRFSRTRLAALATLGVAITAPTPMRAHAQYVFTNVVDTNTAAPSWGVFEAFSDASISGNTIAFKGYYSDGINDDTGIFTGSAGALTTIASRGNTAAPGGGTFDNFSSVSISGSTVAFRGDYFGGTGSVGIFTGSGGALTTIASDGAGNNAVPGGGIFNFFDGPSISGSTVGFFGYYNDYANSGVFTGSGGALTTIVSNEAGSNAVPGGGIFDSIGGKSSLSLSGNNAAFWASYSGGTGSNGIFMGSGGALTTIVSDGAGSNAVPGGGIFNSLNSPIISGNTVAFFGKYGGGTGTRGIFTGSGGALTSIVTDADTVPGGGTWSGFGSLSISGSTVAFTGFYSGDTGKSSGIFLSSGGSLTKLIGDGDTLFGSTIDSFRFESTGLDGTSLAFQYDLADGRSGIALATLASSAPEPGTLALLSLGGTLVFVQRRRKTILGGV